jgi:CRP/FNR family transcriptional regulator, cyclic AMP receptor protein
MSSKAMAHQTNVVQHLFATVPAHTDSFPPRSLPPSVPSTLPWSGSILVGRGSYLLQQGSLPKVVYFVEHGLIKQAAMIDSGEESIIGLRSEGEFVGEMAAILNRPSLETAETLSESRLLYMSAEAFRAAIQTAPIWEYMSRVITAQLWKLTAALIRVKCCTSRQHLESFLHSLCSSNATDKPVKIIVPMKYHELAQLLAVTPSYLCRLFCELEKDQLIQRTKGWIYIPAPCRLWHL